MISNQNRWLLWLTIEEIVSLNAIIVSTNTFYHMNKKMLRGVRVIRDVMVFFLAEGAVVANEGIAALIDMHVA
jgi:hypothetical protein